MAVETATLSLATILVTSEEFVTNSRQEEEQKEKKKEEREEEEEEEEEKEGESTAVGTPLSACSRGSRGTAATPRLLCAARLCLRERGMR